MSQARFQTLDDQTRKLMMSMLDRMRHATLAVPDTRSGHPHQARILCQTAGDGTLTALLAGIATHSQTLARDPRAGLLVEQTEEKGDTMTWPRLSLQVTARLLPANADIRDRWLQRHPRSRLFIDLPDFRFWSLTPQRGLLNAGFGAALRLTDQDLRGDDAKTPP